MSACLLVCLFLLLIAGCTTAPRPLNGPTEPMVSVEQIIARYNANARKIERLWSDPSIVLSFRDPDSGKMREQVGNGNLIYIRPSRVALGAGKLGEMVLLAGTNDRQFWLFDLQDDKTAYVGSYARLGEPGTQVLPLPVRPDRLPVLLGLLPIDGGLAYSEWHDGDLLVEPKWGARRLLLDPRNGLAKRIDLLDHEGRSVIVCTLTGSKRVRQQDIPADQGALMPAEAHIAVVGEEGSLTLKLANMTDDPDKFKPKLFDFDFLVKAYKPKRVIDLDQPASE
ncbi:MAG: hypothetical protein IT445_07880 [Phycisphaeraceae bacterium]|nr:hypothetical protein [Phycisphaeraceae bacterium]